MSSNSNWIYWIHRRPSSRSDVLIVDDAPAAVAVAGSERRMRADAAAAPPDGAVHKYQMSELERGCSIPEGMEKLPEELEKRTLRPVELLEEAEVAEESTSYRPNGMMQKMTMKMKSSSNPPGRMVEIRRDGELLRPLEPLLMGALRAAAADRSYRRSDAAALDIN